MRKNGALWVYVTDDKYEFPIYVCDTALELASKLGVSDTAVYSAISHAKRRGFNCRYKRVEVCDAEI